MATTVAEIQARLSLATGQFDSKLAQSSAAMNAAGSNIASRANMVKAAVGGAMIIAGAAITGFVSKSVKAAEEWGLAVKNMTRLTGTSAEESSKLLFIFRRFGIESQQATRLMVFFSKSVMAAANAANPAETAFGKLGISVKDSGGHIKPFVGLLGETADKLNLMQNGIEKNNLVAEIFGRRVGTQMFPILELGSKGIADLAAQAEKLGLVMNEQNIAQVLRFTKAHKELSFAFQGVKLAIGLAVMPMLTKLFDGIQGIINKFNALSPATKQFIGSILGIAGPLLMVLGAFIGGAAILGMFNNALGGIGLSFSKVFLSPAGLVIVAVGALVIGIVLLLKHFGLLKPAIDAIGNAFSVVWKWLTDVANAVWTFVKPAFDILLAAASVVWNTIMTFLVPALQFFWQQIQPFLPVLKDIAIVLGVIIVGAIIVFTIALLLAVAIVAAVVAAIATAIGFIAKFAVASFNQIKGVVMFVWNAIQAGAIMAWNTIKSVVRAGINFIMSVVRMGVSNVLAIWGGIMRIPGIVSNALGSALNFARGIIGGFVNVGRDIINGIVSGIQSLASHPIDALRNIGISAIDAVKHLLHIGSPSKVFHEIGQNMMLGMTNGILANAGLVTKALDTSVPTEVGSSATAQQRTQGQTVINVHMDGVMTRSRSDMRAVAADLVSSLNESLKARNQPTIPNIIT